MAASITDTVPRNGGNPRDPSWASAAVAPESADARRTAATSRRVTGGQLPQFEENHACTRSFAALKAGSSNCCIACCIAAITSALGG